MSQSKKDWSRREFLKQAALGGAALPLWACVDESPLFFEAPCTRGRRSAEGYRLLV